MHYLIVNPIAGNGRSLHVAGRVEAELSRRGIEFVRLDSEYPGQCADLAKQAVDQGALALVSVGGDGTLRELVGAVAGKAVTLYIAPCGTGNDFIKTLRLPRDPLEALIAQLDGEMVMLDAGEVNGKWFINTSGTGFQIEVLLHTLRHKQRYSGGMAYLLGVFSAIKGFRAMNLEIECGDAKLKKRVTLLEVANGQYIGGGMRVAPTADPTDGRFDVYYVDAVPRAMIPLILPFFMTGLYRYLPITHVIHGTEIAIKSEGMTINADGELLKMDEARYRLRAACVRMRVSDSQRLLQE